MLREFELEAGVQAWAVGVERAVRTSTSVVKSNEQICPRVESLLIAEICGSRSLPSNLCTGKNVIGNRVVVIELKRSRKDRIKAGDEWPQAFCACDAERSRASTSCPCAGSTRSRSDGSTQAAHTATRSILNDAEVDAEELVCARLRTHDFRIRNTSVVSLNRDIEVVLERNGDGVIHRKIDLACSHELVELWRVGKVRRCDFARRVRRKRVRKISLGLGIVQHLGALARGGRLRQAGLGRGCG